LENLLECFGDDAEHCIENEQEDLNSAEIFEDGKFHGA
jgi:hypothetical protein